jgi:hypothetical protein
MPSLAAALPFDTLATTQGGTATWVTILVASLTGLLGLAGGTAVAAFFTTRHQRTEAVRERLLAVSREYIGSYNNAVAAFHKFRNWVLDTVENDARKESIDFYKVVEMHISRLMLYQKYSDEVLPKYLELRQAGHAREVELF